MSMPPKLGPGLAKSPREAGEREARARFVRARRAIGSQLEVSILLGIGQTTIEDWERGAARVPAWALLVLEGRVAA